MVIGTHEPEKRDEVMQRRIEKGLMVPEGMKVLGEWSAVAGGRSFTLVEVQTPELL